MSPFTLSRRWLVLGVVSLTQLVVVLDSTIVNVALPRAQAELSLADTDRHWVVTAYVLAFGSLLLLGGRVVDHWGRKRTFLLGLGLFGAASIWGGLAPDGVSLFLARGGQGIAAALLAPAALAIVTVTFPSGKERNSAFAIFGSVSGAGAMMGLLLGGVLTEYASWRWCLLINVPIVIVGILLGASILTESKSTSVGKYDLWGAVTVACGFGLLVFGLTQAEQAITEPLALGPILFGLSLLALFFRIEHRSPAPLLPLYVVRDRTRGAAFILQMLMGAVMIGAILYLTFHLQTVLKMEPFAAGLATLPITASLMATVPFAIRIMGTFGPRRQLIFGPLISTVGMLWLSRLTPTGSYWVEILPGMILLGVGVAFSVVPIQNLALQNVAARDSGAAAAASNAASQVGGSLGLSVITLVYVSVVGHSGSTSIEGVVAGHSAVFLSATGLLCASTLIAALMIRVPAPKRLDDDGHDLAEAGPAKPSATSIHLH